MNQSNELRPIPPLLRKMLQKESVQVKLRGAKINIKTHEIWNPLSRTAGMGCGKRVEKLDVPESVVKSVLDAYQQRMYQNHQHMVYSRWYRAWDYERDQE